MGENWGALQVTSYRICGPKVPLDSFPGFGIIFSRVSLGDFFFLFRICLRRIQGIVGGLTDQLILMNCLLPTREESISRPTFLSSFDGKMSSLPRSNVLRCSRDREELATTRLSFESSRCVLFSLPASLHMSVLVRTPKRFFG